MPSRFAHLAEAADLCDDDREPEYMHSDDAHEELERDDEMNALGVAALQAIREYVTVYRDKWAGLTGDNGKHCYPPQEMARALADFEDFFGDYEKVSA